MSPEEQAKLLQFLDKNSDIFYWSTSDLIGVSREVIEYKLQVNSNAKPKKQEFHKMSKEKNRRCERRSVTPVRCRVYQRSNIPALVSQHCDGPQEEQKMANVHGLYRS
jgi:hypothetical protein